MKILVTGAQGQVGWELSRSLLPLGEVTAVGRDRCDFAHADQVVQLVGETRPDVIVNAAGYTAVDRAEQEEALAYAVNAEAARVLAQEARRRGALLIHYSTDYVYDGEKPSPYLEDDPARPINAYGRTKLAGENLIRDTGCDHLILRASWVYAARGRNFLRTIVRLARERDVLSIVEDQHGAPTWARNIADATAHILGRATMERQSESFRSGTFHLTASGATSWHGFASAITDQLRALRPAVPLAVTRIVGISSGEYPTAAKRPRNSRMDGMSVRSRFGIVMPHWSDGLRLCMEEMI